MYKAPARHTQQKSSTPELNINLSGTVFPLVERRLRLQRLKRLLTVVLILIWSTDSEKCIYKTRVFKYSNFAWRPNKKVTDESEVDRRKLFLIQVEQQMETSLFGIRYQKNEKLRTQTRQHSKPLVLVVFSLPDGRFIASADTNNKIVVWSTELTILKVKVQEEEKKVWNGTANM
ncbi:hypothetical protein OUZ56_005778 [Daphnia magna]|uniref:Uncharacterized protein n=1 Tax=Daphnia magna TaxID=35525 RepID=A0ABQ9YTR6_9CRUS|nr:hypothetical protein OUZ56_005778 [Daphnia magna]